MITPIRVLIVGGSFPRFSVVCDMKYKFQVNFRQAVIFPVASVFATLLAAIVDTCTASVYGTFR